MRGRPPRPVWERFWEKVKIGPCKDCWEWQAGRSSDGYGKFRVRNGHVRAHRMAMELLGPEIPDGMIVMHTCDNPLCVNPAHLRIGTIKENSQDMLKKGRGNKPNRDTGHGLSKLTTAEVLRLLDEYDNLPVAPWGQKEKGSVAALTKKWGLSPNYVKQIVHDRKYGRIEK